MSRPKEKLAEFFVDRSLRKSIVEGLRDAGLTIYSMADIYGEERAQLLAGRGGFVRVGQLPRPGPGGLAD